MTDSAASVIGLIHDHHLDQVLTGQPAHRQTVPNPIDAVRVRQVLALLLAAGGSGKVFCVDDHRRTALLSAA
ncbi:MAG: hypothetical protein INR62_07465 [Rhodospirillales bacterium]|nr:hypothetical protein [Acetobacter sp.]